MLKTRLSGINILSIYLEISESQVATIVSLPNKTQSFQTMNESTTLTVIFLSIIYGISIPIVYLFSSMYMQNDEREEWKSEVYAVIMGILSPVTILVFLVHIAREYFIEEG